MTRIAAQIAVPLLAACMAAPAAVAATDQAIPDFSGMWGRNAFDFEPLPDGPKPVMNIQRLPNGRGDPNALVGDYTNPILKPAAAAEVKRQGDISLTGTAFPDPSNQCAPWAPPFVFTMQLGLQMLQQKDQITFLYNQDDQVRRVTMNEGHPANLKPTAMGHSVGHYEGDTLVIDTVGVKMGPLSMVDRYGTPHSEALRVVERYRLVDYDVAKERAERHQQEEGPAGLNGVVVVDQDYRGKGLQLTVTVEDPVMFTTPWSATVTYRRTRGVWHEQICAENTREYYDNRNTPVPAALTPDF